MRQPASRWLLDLHLYAGLFVAPLTAVFAVSVLGINHPGLLARAPENRQAVTGLDVPPGLESIQGRERIERLRPILDRLRVKGEVGPVRYLPRDGRLIVPVSAPGRETVVDLNLREGSASISSRGTGLLAATVFLHKAPGPHLANIRGNWVWMRVWQWFTDATAYLILFTTVTGIWLWLIIRAERRSGLAWLLAGAATFFGVVYALCS